MSRSRSPRARPVFRPTYMPRPTTAREPFPDRTTELRSALDHLADALVAAAGEVRERAWDVYSHQKMLTEIGLAVSDSDPTLRAASGVLQQWRSGAAFWPAGLERCAAEQLPHSCGVIEHRLAHSDAPMHAMCGDPRWQLGCSAHAGDAAGAAFWPAGCRPYVALGDGAYHYDDASGSWRSGRVSIWQQKRKGSGKGGGRSKRKVMRGSGTAGEQVAQPEEPEPMDDFDEVNPLYRELEEDDARHREYMREIRLEEQMKAMLAFQREIEEELLEDEPWNWLHPDELE
eukprot:s2326_g17.t1